MKFDHTQPELLKALGSERSVSEVNADVEDAVDECSAAGERKVSMLMERLNAKLTPGEILFLLAQRFR